MDQLRKRNKNDTIKGRHLSTVREVSDVLKSVDDKPNMPKKPKLAGHAPILVQALLPEVSQQKSDDQPQVDVDLVIADYLHHARSSRSMPVLLSETSETDCRGGSLICACCADRNRESLQKKYPMLHENSPRNNSKAKDLPEEHRQRNVQVYNTKTSSEFGHFSAGVISLDYKSLNQISPGHALHSWGYYQPVPSIATFLNPEFNKPFVRQLSRMNAREIARNSYITRKVMEASNKYEHNMKKLQEHFENSFVLPKRVIYLNMNNSGTLNLIN